MHRYYCHETYLLAFSEQKLGEEKMVKMKRTSQEK